MAKEIEIARLVTRLVGDNKQFNRVAQETSKVVEATKRRLTGLKQEAHKLGANMQQVVNGGFRAFNTASTKMDRGLRIARIQIKRTSRDLREMGTAAKIALAGATAAGTGYATKSVYASGRKEQNEIAFGTLIGNAEETKRTLADLKKFAAATPFELPEINVAARGLLTFGERGEELIETLGILGNSASATSSNFGEIALIFNQVRGVGKLLTQDFRQLSTRGVLFLQDIAKYYGVTDEEANQMISTGKVGFEDLREILKGLSSETGRFANMMEKQSTTFLGMQSTISDEFGFLATEIGDQFLPMVKAVQTEFISLLGTLRELPGWVKAGTAALIGFASAVGMASTAWSLFGTRILAIIPIMKMLTTQAILAAASLSGVLAIGGAVALLVAYKLSAKDVTAELENMTKANEDFIKSHDKRARRVDAERGGMSGEDAAKDRGTEIENMTKKIHIQSQMVDRLNIEFIQAGATAEKWVGLNKVANNELSLAEKRYTNASGRMEQMTTRLEKLKKEQAEYNRMAAEGGKATQKQVEGAEKYVAGLKQQFEYQKYLKEGGKDSEKIWKMMQEGIPPETIAQARAYEKALKEMNKEEKTATTGSKEDKNKGLKSEAQGYLDSTMTKYQRLSKEIMRVNYLQSQGFLTGAQANKVMSNMVQEMKDGVSNETKTFKPAFAQSLDRLQGTEFGRGRQGLEKVSRGFRAGMFERQGYSAEQSTAIVNAESTEQRMTENQKLVSAINRVERAILDGRRGQAIGILNGLE